MNDRKEGAFALAQHNAYTVMRNDPGIWNDSLRRALESVLPMVWDEAQAAALAEQDTEEPDWGQIVEYAIEFPGGITQVSDDRGDVEDWQQWIVDGVLVSRQVRFSEWMPVEQGDAS